MMVSNLQKPRKTNSNRKDSKLSSNSKSKQTENEHDKKLPLQKSLIISIENDQPNKISIPLANGK